MDDQEHDPSYAPHFSTLWIYDGLQYGCLHLSNPDNPADIRIIPLNEEQFATMKRAPLAVGTKIAMRRNGVRHEELTPITPLVPPEREFLITGLSGAYGLAATLQGGPRAGEKVTVSFDRATNDALKSALEKSEISELIIKRPVFEDAHGSFTTARRNYILGIYLG